MAGTVDLADLSPEVRRQLAAKGAKIAKTTRTTTMTRDAVRTAAFRVMAVLADLAPAQRERVLRHALKLNEV